MKKQINNKKIATASMAVLGIGLIVGGAFAALSDTLTHNETVTIEWVDIVNGSDDDLALEDVNDVTNTPVTELTPGITYELTGTLENDSTVITDWEATNLTTTPGVNVNIVDVNGDDTPTAVGEDVDVSQFGITVTVEQIVTPSTNINFVIEFNASDARDYAAPPTLTQPTAISVVFPDPALATCVANDSESGANGDVNYLITQDILNGFYDLNCTSMGITNIEGVQYFLNLKSLVLENNQITDISQLSSLINLTSLNLRYNMITNVEPLANLKSLTFLNFSANDVTDITPLAELVNLKNLSMYGNNVTDISALVNMNQLVYLNLASNNISDISVLSNLTNLTTLSLYENEIVDISPLLNLTNLTDLNLEKNQISDFSILTYQADIFTGKDQVITLPDTTLGTPTDIVIDGINGEDLIITFNTPGTYVDGQLTWENPGVNSLTYASTDGSITGTITQTVN